MLGGLAALGLRERLHLYPDDETRDRIRSERVADRMGLIEALRNQALAPAEATGTGGPHTPALVQALHLYLARSSAALVALQLDDLLCMIDPVNVPGTSTEYPNWQRKMSESIETIVARADLRDSLAAIDRERAAHAPPGTKSRR